MYKLIMAGIFAVLAVVCFLAMFFFPTVGLAGGIMDREKDLVPIAVLYAFGTVFPILIFLLDYVLYANHILFDDEKILKGRAFRGYERIAWTEIGRMEVVSADRFCLYDREGKRCVIADISSEHFENFRRMAQKHCRPERQLMSDNETAYQQKFAVRSGQGILRRKAGEYFLIPALFAAMMVLYARRGGVTLPEVLDVRNSPIFFLFVLPPALTLALPFYMMLQQVDYDTQGLTLRRFPRRTVQLRWREVQKIELSVYHLEKRGQSDNLRVTLYCADNRGITIYQHVFPKGFPEFEGFLKGIIERYQIPFVTI